MTISLSSNDQRSNDLSTKKEGSLSVCVLGSGSRGNSIYVGTEKAALLVDAGFHLRDLLTRMGLAQVEPERIKAILVSHGHLDHIRGVGPFSAKFGIPVYSTEKTGVVMANRGIRLNDFRTFVLEQAFSIADITIEAFGVSHDCCCPCGFTVSRANRKIGVVTDLGIITERLRSSLLSLDLLILEANHDRVMLRESAYPAHLKKRIAGQYGHLSNDDSADLVGSIAHKGLKTIILAHLSEENNTPEKARAVVSSRIDSNQTSVTVADQWRCTEMFHL